MSQEQHDKVIDALVEFTLRAASEKATKEEVQVLPMVASVLLRDDV